MTLNGAIMQLVEMRENSMMPSFFKPYLDKVIETVSECDEPSHEKSAQQWIPCNKSLPIEDYYPDDNEYHSKWAGVTIKSRQTGKHYMDIARTVNGKWEMLHTDFDGGFPCKDVPYWADIVAWMPLPEPWTEYETEGEDG